MPDTNPRLSYSRINPRLQLAWDSTSLSAFKRCPQYYNLAYIHGYTLFGDESPHLKFGTLLHSTCETYDILRIGNFDRRFYRKLRQIGIDQTTARSYRQGVDHETAILVSLRRTIFDAFDCEHNRPWISSEPTKTLKTLLRTIVWYLDFFETDHLKTLILENGRPAVELSFRVVLNDLASDETAFTSSTGEQFLLCGHMDKGVEWNGEIYVTDKKTTKGQLNERYFENYNPDNQVSVYSIAGTMIFHKPIAGVIIEGIQILVNGSRFMRRPIPRTQNQLEEWLTDLQFFIRQADLYAQLDYYPRNDTACDKYGGCMFRKLCGADPNVRAQILKSFYTKREGWDPLKTR